MTSRIGAPPQTNFPKSKAVILLGGPNHQESHFRPLSLDLPKPLFPVAGREMLYHHVEACSRVSNLMEIIMIGSYDEGLFQRFFDDTYRRLGIQLRYMKEIKALGTAGGIRFFYKEIMENDPTAIYVLNCDICCTFPLNEMMRFHMKHSGQCTVLGKRVFQDEAKKYGCVVQHPDTREILHWAEKPETFVSDTINCGIYLFDTTFLEHRIVSVGDALSKERSVKMSPRHGESTDMQQLFPDMDNYDNLRLEQDVLMPLAGQKTLYIFETGDFWCQIKTPGMAIICSEMYMQRFRYMDPSLLSTTGGKNSPRIEGNVVIHPSASVHPSAKLGPNVCIAAGATIGAGVRVAHSIILEGVTVKDRSCILFSIIGWNSIVGQWTRIEGKPPSRPVPSSSANSSTDSSLTRDVTIFGVSVVTSPEIIVRNCIVLPHKSLKQSVHDEILL